MNLRLVRRLAAAVALTAAAGPGLVLATGAAPAAAATCSTASGVSVLVDFKELGGGIQGSCVPDGAGQRASALLPAAGFPLTYVQTEPGFVCRVSGKPAQDPCVDTPPNDAYWGLWWSDGKSGSWNYANYGASALKVPAGSSVAFAWKQGGGSATAPGVAPAVHQAPAPTKSPTKTPTKQPTKSPTKAATKAATKAPTKAPSTSPSARPGTPTTQPTASDSATSTASPSASPSASASAAPTESASVAAGTTSGVPSDTPTASPSDVVRDPVAPVAAQTSEDGGVPTWLVLAMLVAVLGVTGAVVVHRRRSAGSSGP
ncbi:hypothetical protein [Nocardioides sp. W7]|uniref:hypothetical protein n=1 Tax=Nocardioides sp. W7 TaxID=2931390 RepID=UPI001FD16ABD|nr:hypothetical protein [Nocardioides sp. W7]